MTARERWAADSGRCQARSSKGHQCKKGSRVMGREVCGGDDFETVAFVPGVTDRCCHHQLSVLLDKAADPDCSQLVIDNLEGVL
jgi:hypothetical protein